MFSGLRGRLRFVTQPPEDRPAHYAPALPLVRGMEGRDQEQTAGATPDSLPLVAKATYLGALLGRKITTEEIFRKALEKAKARLHLYHPYREQFSVPKRVVVVNVFVLPSSATLGGSSSSQTQP